VAVGLVALSCTLLNIAVITFIAVFGVVRVSKVL
jgi:hypothetical protein